MTSKPGDKSSGGQAIQPLLSEETVPLREIVENDDLDRTPSPFGKLVVARDEDHYDVVAEQWVYDSASRDGERDDVQAFVIDRRFLTENWETCRLTEIQRDLLGPAAWLEVIAEVKATLANGSRCTKVCQISPALLSRYAAVFPRKDLLARIRGDVLKINQAVAEAKSEDTSVRYEAVRRIDQLTALLRRGETSQRSGRFGVLDEQGDTADEDRVLVVDASALAELHGEIYSNADAVFVPATLAELSFRSVAEQALEDRARARLLVDVLLPHVNVAEQGSIAIRAGVLLAGVPDVTQEAAWVAAAASEFDGAVLTTDPTRYQGTGARVFRLQDIKAQLIDMQRRLSGGGK